MALLDQVGEAEAPDSIRVAAAYAEILARPALTDTLLRARYAWDPEIHRGTRDAAQADRVLKAMMQMVKLDGPALEAAARG